MASNPDSIYYNPEDVEVLINEYTPSGTLNNTVVLKDTLLGEFTAINGASPYSEQSILF